MSKIYINRKEVKENDPKNDLIIMFLELLVSALTLLLASAIFKGFYVQNILYALVTALIISVLNATIKPLLVYLTLPVTIMSWGILYPIVNLFILKIASLLMGSAFIVEGWILPFFITLFISFVTKLLSELIVKPFMDRR